MAFLSYDGLFYFWQKIKALLAGKVDKVDGKGLSTNDYTTAEKTKLAGLMNYIHPTTSGNKHIPAGGSANQILGWSADGTAKWVNEKDTTYSVMSGATIDADGESGLVPSPTKGSQRWLDSTGAWTTPPNTTYGAASSTSAGLMSAADKKKLDGIATGANKYVHPNYTAQDNSLYKITVDATGHVSAVTAVAKGDITALGIPSTNTTYGTFKGATTSEAGSTGLVIAPVAGNANRYLRSDGTWAVPPDTNTTYGVFAKATADVAGSTGLVPAPAKGQQTYYLRGDGTWAVPANTWRGIQDNLTSSSTTDSLSANQGKVLKGLIDGKAASGHTHNYAGSSSAGGAATSANKVNAALTINLNGTSQGAWDGSSAKSISITAASVGATSVTISRW